MRSGRLVFHLFIPSFHVQDYSKSSLPISLQLGIMIGPTNRKNRFTFGDDLITDTDSRSLSTFFTIVE